MQRATTSPSWSTLDSWLLALSSWLLFWLIAKLNTRRVRAFGPRGVAALWGRSGKQAGSQTGFWHGYMHILRQWVQCTRPGTYLVQWPHRSSALWWPANSSGIAERSACAACDRSNASVDTAASRATRVSACRQVWKPEYPDSIKKEREREKEQY